MLSHDFSPGRQIRTMLNHLAAKIGEAGAKESWHLQELSCGGSSVWCYSGGLRKRKHLASRLAAQFSACTSRSPSLQWKPVSHEAVTSTCVSAVPGEMCTPWQELKSFPRCHALVLPKNKAGFPHRGYSWVVEHSHVQFNLPVGLFPLKTPFDSREVFSVKLVQWCPSLTSWLRPLPAPRSTSPLILTGLWGKHVSSRWQNSHQLQQDSNQAFCIFCCAGFQPAPWGCSD